MFFRRKPAAEPPFVYAYDDDFDELIAVEGVALVDFWAPWCAPCGMMAPILGEIAFEWADRGVRVVKVNVDEAPKVAGDFGIRSIPTLMFFRDGEPLFEMVGLVSKPILERELEEALSGAPAVETDEDDVEEEADAGSIEEEADEASVDAEADEGIEEEADA